MTTLIIAFVLILLAILGLAIGVLLTGKPKIIRGACGMDPNKLRDEKCGKNIHCDLCDKGKSSLRDETDS